MIHFELGVSFLYIHACSSLASDCPQGWGQVLSSKEGHSLKNKDSADKLAPFLMAAGDGCLDLVKEALGVASTEPDAIHPLPLLATQIYLLLTLCLFHAGTVALEFWLVPISFNL